MPTVPSLGKVLVCHQPERARCCLRDGDISTRARRPGGGAAAPCTWVLLTAALERPELEGKIKTESTGPAGRGQPQPMPPVYSRGGVPVARGLTAQCIFSFFFLFFKLFCKKIILWVGFRERPGAPRHPKGPCPGRTRHPGPPVGLAGPRGRHAFLGVRGGEGPGSSGSPDGAPPPPGRRPCRASGAAGPPA